MWLIHLHRYQAKTLSRPMLTSSITTAVRWCPAHLPDPIATSSSDHLMQCLRTSGADVWRSSCLRQAMFSHSKQSREQASRGMLLRGLRGWRSTAVGSQSPHCRPLTNARDSCIRSSRHGMAQTAPDQNQTAQRKGGDCGSGGDGSVHLRPNESLRLSQHHEPDGRIGPSRQAAEDIQARAVQQLGCLALGPACQFCAGAVGAPSALCQHACDR